MRFFDFLFPPREDEMIIRAAAAEELLARLSPELVGSGGGAVTALLPFPDPLVRAAVHEAKYRGSAKAFDLLAAALADYLRDWAAERAGLADLPIVLVPVPLGPRRRRERGFNQVEEVLRRTQRRLRDDGVPCSLDASLLARTRETVSQVSLPRRKRLANLQGAFACPSKLDGRSGAETVYIVCDDVFTTGATLGAAAAALAAAGAENVLAVALAH